MTTPSFKEDHISQIPALQMFVKLGYNYLSPEEALTLRYNKLSNVILDDILIAQLKNINRINYKGKEYLFSESNILDAVNALKDFPLTDGLIRTNEKVYDLLTLGKSFEQNIEGDRKSFSLKYIDWDNFNNNIFHVSEEFEVQRSGSNSTYRPDIILFVNGIPLVVIECKRPDLKNPLEEAISQHLRNQQDDGIRNLFIYSQVLLSLSENDAKYATTGTKPEFWAKWKEQHKSQNESVEYNSQLKKLRNKSLNTDSKNKLFSSRYKYVRNYFEELENEELISTEQDKLIFNVCRPDRLLELIYQFIVYDTGLKKIARYQQYFAVKNTIDRIRIKEQGRRTGGVIWHTQGSGKSITMVMLAKSIALDKTIRNPRIILVTDRIDLDDQIYNTFLSCGKEVSQAKSGRHLMKLVNDNTKDIITTIIDKFEASLNIREFNNTSSDIFVLVDESHRSQYGIANVKMQKVLPNACFIGFTGTPIMKKEKNTITKFGGLIDNPYTIDKAVADKAVVPLLYEGRHVIQNVDEKPIDTYFEMVCESLSVAEKADLKKKYSTADHLNEAEQKIYRIAWDISLHFKSEWQGTGFKGQLATSSKNAALKYKEYLEQIGIVDSEVLISAPDQREGYEDIDNPPTEKVYQFWKNMMKRFGNETDYNKQIINSFKYDDTPEIIIVVDKLLTGFDAPRNVVLYIAKNLKEHGLLQAIARVNRLYEGKDFGYIIDFYGILGNLDEALSNYSALSEFDEQDLKDTLTSINVEIEKLPQLHSQLWDIFKSIRYSEDVEKFQELLSDNPLRDQFYTRLSEFSRTLKIALSTISFNRDTPGEKIDKYKDDAKFFLALRATVQKRYSDKIDYKQYEKQIQRLIDIHIKSDEIIKITEPVNIFEKDKFQEEVEKMVGSAAKADIIATRTAKSISEKIDEDPAFYKKFSRMLEEVIEEFRQKRITDAEYLSQVKDIMNSVVNRVGDDVPEILKGRDVAKAFYGISMETIDKYGGPAFNLMEICADLGVVIDDIIRKNIVVDWHSNLMVQNQMRQEIDDYLYSLKDSCGIAIPVEEHDTIIEKSIEIAKHRY